MLFNSLPFLFGFFPIALLAYYFIGRHSHMLAGLWLASCSLFFYGWWNPTFVGLLLGSVIFNYAAGYAMSREIRKPGRGRARATLTAAVAIDLALLGYYKYAGFFAAVTKSLSGLALDVGLITLPLGISFFTFTQIAFLVDVYQGKAREFNFVHYLLFVTYFPHLIAGPILHHSQMMPQFAERKTYRLNWTNMSVGLTVFVIGLAKKVLLADSFAKIAVPVFAAAGHGAPPPMIVAWAGALAYTLQLYFDFSGYSDMAIGLSLFFNVRLPLNFNSPYKATSIVDFWRRWHMTLSRFLRDYLYIPLGGNRKGTFHRYLNLMITMLLGGLWHGAGWTFVVWGGLHGLYLAINHAFRALCDRAGWKRGQAGRVGTVAASALTFLSVVVGWVFFRSDSFRTAITMLHGMVGGYGWDNPANWFPITDVREWASLEFIAVGLWIVWFPPNAQEIVRNFAPSSDAVASPGNWTARVTWQPQLWWAWPFVGCLLAMSLLMMSPTHVSEFLYYQF